MFVGVLPNLSSLLKLKYLAIAATKITGAPRCDLIIPQLPTGITKIDMGTCGYFESGGGGSYDWPTRYLFQVGGRLGGVHQF
jgi:hypothetical protein